MSSFMQVPRNYNSMRSMPSTPEALTLQKPSIHKRACSKSNIIERVGIVALALLAFGIGISIGVLYGEYYPRFLLTGAITSASVLTCIGIAKFFRWCCPRPEPTDNEIIEKYQIGEKILRIKSDCSQISDISLLDLGRICCYIETHKVELQERATLTNESIFVHSSDELPRSIQFDPDWSIFIHFNRKKMGDDLLGYGSFKIVKYALEYDPVIWYASSSMEENDGIQELQRLELVKNISGMIKKRSHVSYKSKKQILKVRLLTSLCSRGNLRQFMDAGITTQLEKKFIASQLISTLKKLHKNGLLHRDLKSENCLINSDGNVIIADVGTLCYQDSAQRNDDSTTSWYASPEYARVWLDTKGKGPFLDVTTTKHDIWSLGCILYELYFLPPQIRLPWGRKKNHETFDKIVILKDGWFPEPHLSDSIEHVIWEMLRIDPNLRPSLEVFDFN